MLKILGEVQMGIKSLETKNLANLMLLILRKIRPVLKLLDSQTTRCLLKLITFNASLLRELEALKGQYMTLIC